MVVSKTGIHNILKNKGKQRNSNNNAPKSMKKRQPQPCRTVKSRLWSPGKIQLPKGRLHHVWEHLRQQFHALYPKIWISNEGTRRGFTSSVWSISQKGRQTGIRSIPFSEIPVKFPDAAPMDFCAFGLLKRALGNRRPRTVNGLWKAVLQEWERIDLAKLQRSLIQWKLRCRAIVRQHGHQIEHNRWWRHGFS